MAKTVMTADAEAASLSMLFNSEDKTIERLAESVGVTLAAQMMATEFQIRFVAFSAPDADTEGYNVYDYIASDVLNTSYATAEAAQAALDAAYRGADSEGIDALFEIEAI